MAPQWSCTILSISYSDEMTGIVLDKIEHPLTPFTFHLISEDQIGVVDEYVVNGYMYLSLENLDGVPFSFQILSLQAVSIRVNGSRKTTVQLAFSGVVRMSILQWYYNNIILLQPALHV